VAKRSSERLKPSRNKIDGRPIRKGAKKGKLASRNLGKNKSEKPHHPPAKPEFTSSGMVCQGQGEEHEGDTFADRKVRCPFPPDSKGSTSRV